MQFVWRYKQNNEVNLIEIELKYHIMFLQLCLQSLTHYGGHSPIFLTFLLLQVTRNISSRLLVFMKHRDDCLIENVVCLPTKKEQRNIYFKIFWKFYRITKKTTLLPYFLCNDLCYSFKSINKLLWVICIELRRT